MVHMSMYDMHATPLAKERLVISLIARALTKTDAVIMLC